MSPATRITQALRAMSRFVPLAVLLGLAFLLAITERAVAEPPQGFVLHAAPKALPELAFADGEGQQFSLADFRGRTVLLNVWATWCPPCVQEMPMLDRLEVELGGSGFEVVALSIDRAGPAGTDCPPRSSREKRIPRARITNAGGCSGSYGRSSPGRMSP